MATKRMLIDAAHAEETRVVVLSGNRLEEFDVEAAHRQQLKGNTYLAKVTRVEPSLQAAFVEYGGNRHGFLAFNEIHPDYYQIPIADREALLAEEKEEAGKTEETDNGVEAEAKADANADHVEVLGGDDADEMGDQRAKATSRRRYKIQEVIKRRQVLLVQVVKEERGNKGAALTTYVSLAGRYCVLMPNTDRGGGISRKIASITDRKRLKNILADFGIPEGMAVIVRTAGAERTKTEIKRDYEYLLRLWDNIRTTTLESTAPTLIHEEGNLIKRSIRDLYGNDIDEIIISGDQGYRTAKSFMKLLIPSHAKKVQPYRDASMPLLHRFQVESQLDAMHSPAVQLKSGGSIVINQTEALVAIDVNSGRATRERNIEETALNTNMEAAAEIARQLRLRDLAGLIVIDFIDMEVNRNQTQVERRLKESMRSDRARIQIGRISPFGLLEMSRQRLRPSLHETTFEVCPYCEGTGARRSIESSALYVLRAVEEEGIRKRSALIIVTVTTDIALYILNQKRAALREIENRYGFSVCLERDDSLIPPAHRLERQTAPQAPTEAAVELPEYQPVEEDNTEPLDEEENPEPVDEEDNTEPVDEEGEGAKRKRRRRPRRRKRSDQGPESDAEETLATDEVSAPEEKASKEDAERDTEETQEEQKLRRRRRGRRGGRRRGQSRGAQAETGGTSEPPELLDAPAQPQLLETATKPDLLAPPEAEPSAETKPRQRRSRRRKPDIGEMAETAPGTVEETPEVIIAGPPEPEVIIAGPPSDTPPDDEKKPTRKPGRRSKKVEASADEEAAVKPRRRARKEKTPEPEPAEEKPAEAARSDPAAAKTTVIDVDAAEKPKRSGWWSR